MGMEISNKVIFIFFLYSYQKHAVIGEEKHHQALLQPA